MTFKEEIYKEWRERTGYISNEDGEKWLNSIVDRTIQLCKEAVPEVKKCSACGQVWTEEERDYDGKLNCHVSKRECPQPYNYNDDWDDLGWNACRETTLQNLSALEKE